MDARPAPGPAAQPPVPAELTAPGWNGDVLRAGVALLAIDLLMVAATTEDRTAARSLVLEELGGCGVLERSALCEVLRRMTSEQALLAAWLDLPADAPPSADAAVPWLLAALAADSALQRRADSRARRAEHRDGSAQPRVGCIGATVGRALVRHACSSALESVLTWLVESTAAVLHSLGC